MQQRLVVEGKVVSRRFARRLGPEKGEALPPKHGKTICGLQSVGLRRSPRRPLECGGEVSAFARTRVNQGRSEGSQSLEVDRRTEPPARDSGKSRKQTSGEEGRPAGRDRPSGPCPSHTPYVLQQQRVL